MSHRKALYETQLAQLTTAMQARAKLLEGRKFDEKRQARDPVFRGLKARVKQMKRRIASIQRMVELDAATKQRKAERLAMPKQPKEKKKKEAPPVKAKGGGKAKGEGKAKPEA